MSQSAQIPRSEDELWRRLVVDPTSYVPLATQLGQQLRWLMVSGAVPPESTLPPIRRLGEQLGISFHTVRAAYQQLEAQGLVVTRQGIGTTVLRAHIGALAREGQQPLSFAIGVMIPEYTDFYGPLLRGVRSVAADHPWLYFICDAREDQALAESYFDQLIARGVDGIIVVSVALRDRDKASYVREHSKSFPPIVFADLPSYPPPSVLFDLQDAAYQAAQHILQHGHRRVGLVIPPRQWLNVAEFFRGYERGLAAGGVTPLVAEVADFGADSGCSGAAQLLDAAEPPTALLLPGDTLAAGALKAIQERRLRVPEDVALIAFNRNLLFELMQPTITSVELPAFEMGSAASGLLQRAMAGEDVSRSEIVLRGQLIVRRSCGCEG